MRAKLLWAEQEIYGLVIRGTEISSMESIVQQFLCVKVFPLEGMGKFMRLRKQTKCYLPRRERMQILKGHSSVLQKGKQLLVETLTIQAPERMYQAEESSLRGVQRALGFQLSQTVTCVGGGLLVIRLLFCFIIHIFVSDPNKNPLVPQVGLRCDHDFGLPWVLFLG